MPMDRAQFRFPDEADADPDTDTIDGTMTDRDVSDEVTVDPLKAATADASGIEVEIVDDTPEVDRGREPMKEPPKDFADDELQKYDESVRVRIKKFAKGYHDERRRAETAERQREAAVQAAAALAQRSQQLEESLSKSQEALLAQAKRVVQTELEKARQQYKEAHETGDAEAVLKAHEALSAAQARVEKVNSFKPAAANTVARAGGNGVQPAPQPQVASQPPAPKLDEKALAWQERNSWFGKDRRMTAYALALHSELVEQGVDPLTDDYYDKVNAEMRRTFPGVFKAPAEKPEAPTSGRRSSVVAPATRSSPASQRITLTKSQLEIARRLNVTPQQYAMQVLALNRKS